MNFKYACANCGQTIVVKGSRGEVVECPICFDESPIPHNAVETTQQLTRPLEQLKKAQNSHTIQQIEEEQNYRFKTLAGLGKFFAGIGWIIVVISLIAGFIVSNNKNGFGGEGVIGLIVGIIGSVQGLLIVGTGQLLQCIAVIENNTRRLAEKI